MCCVKLVMVLFVFSTHTKTIDLLGTAVLFLLDHFLLSGRAMVMVKLPYFKECLLLALEMRWI